tara:strand:- start:361 stop:483 length:123 start_codon:yes stop_codon:yes gene_type:complete
MNLTRQNKKNKIENAIIGIIQIIYISGFITMVVVAISNVI